MPPQSGYLTVRNSVKNWAVCPLRSVGDYSPHKLKIEGITPLPPPMLTLTEPWWRGRIFVFLHSLCVLTKGGHGILRWSACNVKLPIGASDYEISSHQAILFPLTPIQGSRGWLKWEDVQKRQMATCIYTHAVGELCSWLSMLANMCSAGSAVVLC